MNTLKLDFVQELLEQNVHWFDQPEKMKLARMTSNNYPYTRLFSPIQVNRLTLKNRIVMGPLGNFSMAEEMGRPSNKMIEYFTERARGGAGLLTSGLIPISQAVAPTVTERGNKTYFPRIDSSRTVFSGWRDLAEAVHAHGARFFIQLTAGLGRVGSPESLLTKYKMPVSASWNPNFYIPGVPCRPMTDAECHTIIKAGGQCVSLRGHFRYHTEVVCRSFLRKRRTVRSSRWTALPMS